MTILDLIKELDKYPSDMEVITDLHSDYAFIPNDGVGVVGGVQQSDWIMRSHYTMTDYNKKKEKKYLLISPHRV